MKQDLKVTAYGICMKKQQPNRKLESRAASVKIKLLRESFHLNDIQSQLFSVTVHATAATD